MNVKKNGFLGALILGALMKNNGIGWQYGQPKKEHEMTEDDYLKLKQHKLSVNARLIERRLNEYR